MSDQNQFELPFAATKPSSTSSLPSSPPPITFSDLPPTVPETRPIAKLSSSPSTPFASLQQAIAMRAFVDAIDDVENETNAREPLWSLRSVLERAPAAPPGAVVEVLRFRNERVEYRLLGIGDRTKRIELRRRGLAFVDGVPLRPEGAAFDEADGSRVVVRFAHPPSLVWTAALVAEQRFRRKLHVVATSAGSGVMALFGFLLWLAQYIPDERGYPIADDAPMKDPPIDWGPIVTVPKPKPEPAPKPDPTPERASSTTHERAQRPSPSPVPRSATQSPTPAPSKPDIIAGIAHLPSIKSDAMNNALLAMHEPLTSNHPTIKIEQMIGHGPQELGIIGGGPLTGVSRDRLRNGGKLASAEVGNGGPRGHVDRVALGAIKRKGGALSPEDIQRVVNEHIGEIQVCYERQLNHDQNLRGRVVIDWTVKTDGTVGKAGAAQNDLGQSPAVQCMLDHLKRWHFPVPQGGEVSVSYPFVFRAVGS